MDEPKRITVHKNRRNHTPRVAVVTGASGGVGRATVREFAREGASIGLLARGLDRLNAAKNEVEDLGGKALILPTDVADPDQVEAAAANVEREFGPIDVWVNNAMTTIFSPFVEIKPDEYRRATEVTYLGCVYGTMAALKRMKPRDRGVIVQVGSALAYRSIPLQAPYCGAKHAVVGFTDSIRSELVHDRSNVRITIVHLPGLNTPQFSWCRTRLFCHPQPVPPIFQPEIAARAIVWASSHACREVWVGFSTYKAIIGQRLAPGFADRFLAGHAVERQETEQPVPSDRRDNLFETVPGNEYSAHGEFDDRAKTSALINKIVLNPVAKQLLFTMGLVATGFALIGSGSRLTDRQH
jgi:NAD(P)-dependent dehydrogenase (short-subunit alcohol dehydrogenase family)